MSKGRILLIEPDTEYAARCIQELNKFGYDVNHISASRLFSRVFKQFKDDWAVIIVAPYLDGYSFCTDQIVRHIKEDKRVASRVKILANASTAEHNKMLMDAGCTHRSTNGRFHSWALPKVIEGVFRFA